MTNRLRHGLNRAMKLLLAAAGVAAVAAPLVIGIAQAPVISAQSRVSTAASRVGSREAAGDATVAPVAATQQATTPPVQTSTPQQGAVEASTGIQLAFDAASIKPANAPGGRAGSAGGGYLQLAPARGTALGRTVTTRRIILEAYHLTRFQLSGGWSWLDSDWFELDAKADGPADLAQLRVMLQTLLSERFKLLAHQETKEVPVYAATVGKKGANLHEVKEGDSEPEETVSAARATQLWGRAANAPYHWGGVATMQEFLQSLSNLLSMDGSGQPLIDRPVVNRTGLQGVYWFRVGWDPDEDPIAAIEEELGLKFEFQKAPIEVLVIDHIEKPDSN